MWLILALISALLLGIYDVSKKVSLQSNAVIPVLFSSILFSCSILFPFLLISNYQSYATSLGSGWWSIDFRRKTVWLSNSRCNSNIGFVHHVFICWQKRGLLHYFQQMDLVYNYGYAYRSSEWFVR